MDFDRKNVTTEPDTNSVSAQPTTVIKKTRSAWSTVAFFFMLMMLVALGLAAWMWMMWQDSQTRNSATKTELTSAQTTIANLREKVGQANGQAAAEANTPINDEALIKTALTEYNAAFASPIKDIKVVIHKRDGGQALATVSDPTDINGFKAYLKKANNTWVVVFAGQNTPPESVMKQFDLKL